MASTQPSTQQQCAKYKYVLTSNGPKIVPVNAPDVESKDEESPDPLQLDMNALLLAVCEGRWDEAIERAKKISENDPDNILFANNLAVSLLNQGRLKEVSPLNS